MNSLDDDNTRRLEAELALLVFFSSLECETFDFPQLCDVLHEVLERFTFDIEYCSDLLILSKKLINIAHY